MEALIHFVLSNIPGICLLATPIAAVIDMALRGVRRTRSVVVERLSAYYVLFCVAIYYFYNFIVHVFFGDFVARYIGWAQSPFQAEVGFASLGFAAAGLVAFGGGLRTRTAAVVGPVCFLWGAAAGHIFQMATAHNFAPGNAGSVFWTDILAPVVGLTLLFLQRRWPSPA